MSNEVRAAVIPAAGWGSRMYPLTKSVPKELLPLVDQPAIMNVITEAQQAGITDFHIVTSPNKPALEHFFTPGPADEFRTEQMPRIPQVNFVVQHQAKGLGHAVLQAESAVGNQAFVVQLPDDIYHPEDPVLQAMLRVHAQTGGCVVALLEVSAQLASHYSSAQVETCGLSGDATLNHQVFRLREIVEKPTPEQVKSPYAVMGRYVLDPRIFRVLHETKPGHKGEIQLTDALATMAALPESEGGGVWGVVQYGRHFDTGSLSGYLQAQLELSAEHQIFGRALRDHLSNWAGESRQ